MGPTSIPTIGVPRAVNDNHLCGTVDAEPVICRCCFENIAPSTDNPTLACPKCGTENKPALLAESITPDSIPLNKGTGHGALFYIFWAILPLAAISLFIKVGTAVSSKSFHMSSEAIVGGVMVLAAIVVAGLIWLWNYLEAERRKLLLQKYGNAAVVDRIMRKILWEGETEEQLTDSLGRPLAVDSHVLKTKITETWKYDSTGRNRYALRVRVDNGIVVGWDKKGVET